MKQPSLKSGNESNQALEFLRRALARKPIRNRLGLYYLEKSPAHFLAYCSMIRSLKGLMLGLLRPRSVVAITVPLNWPMEMFANILEKTLQIENDADSGRRRFSLYVHASGRSVKKLGVDEAIFDKLAHRGLVVLVPAGTPLMPELALVVTQEFDAELCLTRDFAALSRLRRTGPVNETIASILRQQPPSYLTAIFRIENSLITSVARLEQKKQAVSAYDRETLTLDDVPGFGEAGRWGQTLRRDIEEWKAGKLAWSEVDKGLLMVGKPGTGKTMFARLLANSCGLEFFAHSLPQWQKFGHMGDLLKAMNQAFDTARANTPSLLFLDELDSIGDRNTFSGQNENYQTEVLNALLELVDGSLGREGVIVAGATNFPEKIDGALLRSGRLERHFVFEVPDESSRGEILRFYLPGLGGPEVAEFARRLNGWSPADLERLTRGVRRKAREEGRSVVISDLTSELPDKIPLSLNDLQRIAVHEAGHAAVALALGLDLKRVSISRDIDPVNRSLWLGVTTTARPRTHIQTKKEILNEINVCLAGTVAEELFFGERTSFAAGQSEGDLFSATELAVQLIARLGLGSRLTLIPGQGVKDLVRDKDLRAEVDQLLGKQYDFVSTILQRLHNQVFDLAEALQEHGEMTGKQVLDIFADWTTEGSEAVSVAKTAELK